MYFDFDTVSKMIARFIDENVLTGDKKQLLVTFKEKYARICQRFSTENCLDMRSGKQNGFYF